MSWLKTYIRQARNAVDRRRVEELMDEELRLHLEMEAEHLARTEGLKPDEAWRRAHVAFGGVERVKERARDVRWTRWLEDLLQDARIGMRALRRVPGFTLVAVLTLALGVGATTAMFSVVRGVLLTPLPYTDSDRLVAVWGRFLPESGFDFPKFPLSPPEYFDYVAETRTVSDAAAYSGFRATLSSADGALSVRGASATANLFDVLRVAPVLGRAFTSQEDLPHGTAAVVVLGHGLWQRAFGGDRDIVGRTIHVNGIAAEVIGVMPAGFAYPSPETELWRPIGLDVPDRSQRGAHYVEVVARLADGVDMERAQLEMRTLMSGWQAEFPHVHTGHFLYVTPLIDDVVGDARPALLALLGAVGFVLLIVCANVANLLLARGETRRRELAVRSALGAGRQRLVRQFLAEGAVLSMLGTGAGLLLAYLLVNVTLAVGTQSIPRVENIGVDGTVLLFAVGIALLTTIAFALAPLLRAAAEPGSALGDAARTTAGVRSTLVRRALVSAQVALAVVVVIGAGLMLRTFAALTTTSPGFTASRAMIAELSLPAGDYPEGEHVVAFYDELAERLRRLPRAEAVAVTSTLPLGGGASNIDFRIEGVPQPAPGEPAHSGDFIIADAGFAETFGAAVIEGRFFDSSDRAGTLPVVVINRRMAQMFWADGGTVGARLRMHGNDEQPWLHVVGVIDDVQYRTLADEVRPAWYIPLTQMSYSLAQPARSFGVAVRSNGDPSLVAESVRVVLERMDSALPVIRLRSLQTLVDESLARPRFTMTVLSLFATLALVLGAIGIYGVLAYAVTQRARELGIRVALGAGWRELAGIVLGEGFRIVLVGLAAGIAGALLATRLLQDLLYGVSPTDGVTFVAVGLGVCLTTLAASVLPLWRAIHTDPLRVLRME